MACLVAGTYTIPQAACECQRQQNLHLPSTAKRGNRQSLDPQRQWRRAGNVWQNSMARSVLQTMVSPLPARAEIAHQIARALPEC